MNREQASVLESRMRAVSAGTRARIIESRLGVASVLCLVAAAQLEFEDATAAEVAIERGRTAAQSARFLAEEDSPGLWTADLLSTPTCGP